MGNFTKLTVDGFKRVKGTYKFPKGLINSMRKKLIHFLQVDVKYPEQLHKFQNDLPFLPEKMEVNKCEKSV